MKPLIDSKQVEELEFKISIWKNEMKMCGHSDLWLAEQIINSGYSKQQEALLPFEYVKLADFIRENLTQEDIENISCNDWSGLSISVKICSKFGQQRVDSPSWQQVCQVMRDAVTMKWNKKSLEIPNCVFEWGAQAVCSKFSLPKPAEQQFKSVDEIYNFLRKEQTEIFTKSKPKTNHLLIYAKAIFDILYGKDKK